MFYDSYLANNTSYKTGKIYIYVPDLKGEYDTKHPIQGILSGDVAINWGVDWGPVLPDATELSDLSAVLGNQNIMSWVQASAVVWKGSKPLELKTDFYLITLDRNQSPSIKQEAKRLIQLASMYVGPGDTITGQVHGGYTVDFAMSNKKVAYFTEGNFNQSELKKIKDAKGTITVEIGDQFTINHLLLESVTATPSSVQVAKNTPLYIKIEANFRSNRAPLSTDMDSIFGNTPQIEVGNPSPLKNYCTEDEKYSTPAGTDSTYGRGYPASGNPYS